jgi:hypothetical protein
VITDIAVDLPCARKQLVDAARSFKVKGPKPMTAAELFESITNGGMSDFGQVLAVLRQREVSWCLIGGLAVNCYVSSVYTADADFVVATDMIDIVVQGLAHGGFKISQFEFSVNAQKPGSDLIIQFTRDERYQPFVTRAETREVLGCRIPVASLPDLIQGKIWAWQDPRRPLSKRTKDQADLLRIGENYPALLHLLPDGLRQQLQEQQSDAQDFGLRFLNSKS